MKNLKTCLFTIVFLWANQLYAQDFSAEQSYNSGDIVTYKDQQFKAVHSVPAHSFTPSKENPWLKYQPLPTWSSTQVYLKGQRVVMKGQAYEALFWSPGKDPSQPENQNPSKSTGQPWYPLGAWHNYSQQELNNTVRYSDLSLYSTNDLVNINHAFYTAEQSVKGVLPDQASPWQVYVDWEGVQQKIGSTQSSWPDHVYAPYVDMLLWNKVPDLSQLKGDIGVSHFVSAFIVAKSANQCLPSWGAVTSMKDFSQYQNINKLRANGGDIMVSLGGANNTPLAAACSDSTSLTNIYSGIIDNLNLHAIDFDIEGTWITDSASVERRSQALAVIQQQHGDKVKIWFTLPVLPSGLTNDGVEVIRSAIKHHLNLSGINLMTMDFGDNACPKSSGKEGENIQGQCSIDALNNTFQTLVQLYQGTKTPEQLWAMLGATPMIGYNDVLSEVFYKPDAQILSDFTNRHGLGMVGIWSIARDQPSGNHQASPMDSGLDKTQAEQYDFSKILVNGLN